MQAGYEEHRLRETRRWVGLKPGSELCVDDRQGIAGDDVFGYSAKQPARRDDYESTGGQMQAERADWRKPSLHKRNLTPEPGAQSCDDDANKRHAQEADPTLLDHRDTAEAGRQFAATSAQKVARFSSTLATTTLAATTPP